MGKRTPAVSEDYDSIANKIRKLEQKLMRTRRRDRHRTSKTSRKLSSSSTSDTSRSSTRSSCVSRSRSPPAPARGQAAAAAATAQPLPLDVLCIEDVPIKPTSATAAANTTAPAPLPSISAPTATELPSAGISSPLGPSAPTGIFLQPSPTDQTLALDDELLFILGDDPSQTKSYEEHIQPDLVICLQHIARTGLPKDVRKVLTNKYLLLANCTLIKAPILYPEVVAAVPEAVFKSDKGIEIRADMKPADMKPPQIKINRPRKISTGAVLPRTTG